MDETDKDTVLIRTDANGLFELSQTVLPTRTELMPSFKRGYYTQPSYRQGLPRRDCMDEICLIDAHCLPQNQLQFLHFSDPIDCNSLYSPEDEDPLAAAENPAHFEEPEYLHSLRKFVPLEVFKHGAKTGFTEGKLRFIEKLDDDEVPGYMLLIEWISPSEPFAEDGDSGSLVFAKHNGKIVPLGIHYGSEEGVSHAWLLWSWCCEIQESLNADLLFCVHPKCEYAAQ